MKAFMFRLPRISIITPTFNCAATFSKAADSLLSQDYPDLEWLVLDGGSGDGTQEVVTRYQDHIAFMRSRKDGGAGYAYNEGIARASGEIVALLNADDRYEPGILRAVGEAFAADPALDMVTCEARVVSQGADGALQERKYFRAESLSLGGRASPVINARFIRKSVYERYDMFETVDDEGTYLISSDLEFILRLSLQPLRNHILPRLGYTYFAHAGSLTMSGNAAAKQRLIRESGYIARKFLAQGATLSSAHLRRLRRWHCKDNVRRFLRQWRAEDRTAAWHTARAGIKVSPLVWLPYLVIVLRRGE